MDVYTGMDGRTTIFDLLLNPNKEKGYKPLPREVLIDEAFALCFAGTDTTSYGMSCGTYYLLTNPNKLKLLSEELSQVQTNAEGMLEYKDIQHLPYLVSVDSEAYAIDTCENLSLKYQLIPPL
jgi:cytochrome P450